MSALTSPAGVKKLSGKVAFFGDEKGAAYGRLVASGLKPRVIRDFAEIAGTELLVIDEDTTVRGFQKELRWNAAYYRLAQGI